MKLIPPVCSLECEKCENYLEGVPNIHNRKQKLHCRTNRVGILEYHHDGRTLLNSKEAKVG